MDGLELQVMQHAGADIIFDALESCWAGIIRGCGRFIVAAPIVVVSYWVLGMPLALFLGFKQGWGVVGGCPIRQCPGHQLQCHRGTGSSIFQVMAERACHVRRALLGHDGRHSHACSPAGHRVAAHRLAGALMMIRPLAHAP